jgi:hypothetical protein
LNSGERSAAKNPANIALRESFRRHALPLWKDDPLPARDMATEDVAHVFRGSVRRETGSPLRHFADRDCHRIETLAAYHA